MTGPRRSSTAGRKIVRKDPLPKGRACLACKERKVKCNGEWPCKACVRHAKYEGRSFDSSCCEFKPLAAQRTSSNDSDRLDTVPSSWSSTSRTPPDSRQVTPTDLSPVLATFPDVPNFIPPATYTGARNAGPAFQVLEAVAEPDFAAHGRPIAPFSTMPYLPVSAPIPATPYTFDSAKQAQQLDAAVSKLDPTFPIEGDPFPQSVSFFDQYQPLAAAQDESIYPFVPSVAGLTPFLDGIHNGSAAGDPNAPFWAL